MKVSLGIMLRAVFPAETFYSWEAVGISLKLLLLPPHAQCPSKQRVLQR
jgi:hypothetical protein